ncbi:MAG: alpha/beta fold hydrolase [Pseudomonadota bacterium]|nr:alpha/beta fold hydrolase [Pseudomonadota bacterium]
MIRKLALGAVTVLALAYVAICAVLYFNQERMIFPAPQEAVAPAEGFEAVTLQTSDNLALTAHWMEPAAGKPVVVWFHGNGGSLSGATVETTQLAQAGYGLLLVEYRGYGGNPGSPSEAGFYRDGEAAMTFLATKNIPAGKIVIGAHSIGSGTAVEMARRHAPAALILVAPFTSLGDVVAEAVPWVPGSLLLKHRFDNLAKISEIDAPVLVLHGTDDRVVPYALGRKLEQAAPDGTLISFEGAGHELSFFLEAQIAQLEWLKERGL